MTYNVSSGTLSLYTTTTQRSASPSSPIRDVHSDSQNGICFGHLLKIRPTARLVAAVVIC